ncbi:carbon-nitrogen hydrolase family protein [Celeribacter sp.]|uniref:carbon-nitrogen hydrolase family protein n=1 Tax=Celeribacter sp. TaxID=1890673 RepID=UPI003A94D61F
MPKAALLTLNSSDDPIENCGVVLDMLAQAAEGGADIAFTPEVTNCVSTNRAHQHAVLEAEGQDRTLSAIQETARNLNIWVSIGSLALKGDGVDPRFVNRSFLISNTGDILARYDKMHMFDVNVSETESYRESSGYAPGNRAVTAKTPFAVMGLTICYDLRFPYLYRHLAQSGADVLSVPSAFSAATGEAHWEPLLRARAIENGAYVFAAAQTGHHREKGGPKRRTYGHSLAVSPWGDVVFDGGGDVGVGFVDFDVAEVTRARARIPSLKHDRAYGAD